MNDKRYEEGTFWRLYSEGGQSRSAYYHTLKNKNGLTLVEFNLIRRLAALYPVAGVHAVLL